MKFAVHTTSFRRLMRLTLAAYIIANTLGSGIHFHFDALVESFQHDESSVTLHLHADAQQDRSQHRDLGFHSSTQHDHPVPHFVALATATRIYSNLLPLERAPEIAGVVAVHGPDASLAVCDLLEVASCIPRGRKSVLLIPPRAPPIV